MWKRLAHLSFWLGASLYFGGLVGLGAVAAPGIFYVTGHEGVTMPGIGAALDMGNQVGGEIFGEVLNRFVVVEVIAALLLLLGIVVPLVAHRPVRRSASLMFSLWLAVVVLMVYTAGWLHPQIWHQREVLRASAANHVAATQGVAGTQSAGAAAQAESWPEKEAFDSLHARAETLARIKAYLLLGMIVLGSMRGVTEPAVHLRNKEEKAPVA